MENPEMEDVGSVSEGTSEEEDLEEPVTVLQPDFFNKRYDDTTTLFRQYFKAIKKNRYLLTLIAEVLRDIAPCYVYMESQAFKDTGRYKEYPLPKLSGKPQKNNPGASEKIRVTTIEDKGKGLEAVSKIKPGDNVIVEKALALEVDVNCMCSHNAHLTCYHCSNAIFKFVPCLQCDVCVFCDEKCRNVSWNTYHQFECYGVQRHFWTVPYTAMGLRMMLLCIHKASAIETSIECLEKFQVFNSLPTHISNCSIREMNSILHSSARTLVYLIERTNFFQTMMIHRGLKECKPYLMYMYIGGLLVRFTCAARAGALELPIQNVFSDPGDRNLQSVATFVSKTANMLNHSCAPNCILLHNKNYIIIRAIKDIEPKEELTISYLSIERASSFSERLYHCTQRFFVCRCELCREPDNKHCNSFLCRSCPIGRFNCNITPPRCIDCNKEDKCDSFKIAEMRVNNLLKEFKKTNTMRSAEKYLKAAEKLYYPLNYQLFNIYINLYKTYLDNDGYFFRGCTLAMMACSVLKAHISNYSLRLHYHSYKITLDVVKHKNFEKAEWKLAQHKEMLIEFREVLQAAHKFLNLWYELDQLEFLNDAIRYIDNICITSALEELQC